MFFPNPSYGLPPLPPLGELTQSAPVPANPFSSFTHAQPSSLPPSQDSSLKSSLFKPVGSGRESFVGFHVNQRTGMPLALITPQEGDTFSEDVLRTYCAMLRKTFPGVMRILQVSPKGIVVEPLCYINGAGQVVPYPSLENILETGKTTFFDKLNWMLSIHESIEALQQKDLLHTDLSPRNILITPDEVRVNKLSASFLIDVGSIVGRHDSLKHIPTAIIPPEFLHILETGHWTEQASRYQFGIIVGQAFGLVDEIVTLGSGKQAHFGDQDIRLVDPKLDAAFNEIHEHVAKQVSTDAPRQHMDKWTQRIVAITRDCLNPNPSDRPQNLANELRALSHPVAHYMTETLGLFDYWPSQYEVSLGQHEHTFDVTALLADVAAGKDRLMHNIQEQIINKPSLSTLGDFLHHAGLLRTPNDRIELVRLLMGMRR